MFQVNDVVTLSWFDGGRRGKVIEVLPHASFPITVEWYEYDANDPLAEEGKSKVWNYQPGELKHVSEKGYAHVVRKS